MEQRQAHVTFEAELVALIPQLRGYARGLSRVSADADDLVQDCVMRAWAARDRYAPGSNMRAWLFTILRNRFYSSIAAPGARLMPLDDATEVHLAVPASQESGLATKDIARAMQCLHPLLREALVLSAGAELDYAQIGEILGCPVGTVKSRVFRARREMALLLDVPGRRVGRSKTA